MRNVLQASCSAAGESCGDRGDGSARGRQAPPWEGLGVSDGVKGPQAERGADTDVQLLRQAGNFRVLERGSESTQKV